MSDEAGRTAAVFRNLELPLVALALPLFIVVDWPLAGYLVAAGAWLAGRGIELAADRHARAALADGRPRSAIGATAAAMLGRVWLIALAVLIAGLVEREVGLAAALLAAALFTLHLIGRFVARLVEVDEAARAGR